MIMYFTLSENDGICQLDKVSNKLEDFEDIDITRDCIYKTDNALINNDEDIREISSEAEYLGAIYHASNEGKYYKSIYSFGENIFTVRVSEDEYLEYSKFDIATEDLDITSDTL